MGFADNLGPRTQPAWDAILNLLTDGDWHTHDDLVDAATKASDLNTKSIEQLTRKGYRAHHYSRRTQHARGLTKLETAVYRRSHR